MKKLLKFITTSVSAMVLILAFSTTAFAEDLVNCSGAIEGATDGSFNANLGSLSFDQDRLQDLSILGLAPGLAPADSTYAACTDVAGGLAAYGDYAVKGTAWSDNLGFVYFHCGAGKNLGLSCGPFDYFTMINAAQDEMSGYAWNPVLGYINFSCIGGNDIYGNNCGGIDYQVARNPVSGELSGYAWSEAGIWVNVDGIRVGLPDGAVEAGGACETWCCDRPGVCMEIQPNPEDLDFELTPEDVIDEYNNDPDFEGSLDAYLDLSNHMRVADGKDGYRIHLYMREADGITPLIEDDYNFDEFVDSFTFYWKDTVKADQLAVKVENEWNAAPENLGEIEKPWDEKQGAIIWKPITLSLENDFQLAGDGDPSHWVSKEKISSYAPTTEGNLSMTRDGWLFSNELFLAPLENAEGERWDDKVEPNQLILERVEFDLEHDVGGPVRPGVIFPNGESDGVAFPFRSAIDLNTFYANDNQDIIVAYRDIPVNLRVGAREIGELAYTRLVTELLLTYSQSETLDERRCRGQDVVTDFVFRFLSDLDGVNVDVRNTPDAQGNLTGVRHLTNDQNDVIGLKTDSLSVLNRPVDLEAVASLPPLEDGQVPCSTAKGPTLYTTIGYQVDGEWVRHYGNKLPRGQQTGVANPAALIKGQVVAPKAFTPSGETEAVQTSGDYTVNVIKDTVNQNVQKYVGDTEVLTGGHCSIMELGEFTQSRRSRSGSVTYTVKSKSGKGACNTKHYEVFTVGEEATGENVMYFKGSDVYFDLRDDVWSNDGRWVIVVDGGNVFINEDIYTDPVDPLSLVVFRGFDKRGNRNDRGEGGNVYVGPDVKNIDVNGLFEGSVFPYSSRFNLDDATGEIKLDGLEIGDFADEFDKELVWRGSISSRNTIGGSSLDEYLLLGTNEIIERPFTVEDRLRAQLYDLNTLRLFTLDVQQEGGRAVDQRCGMALTNQQILDIARGETVCNEANFREFPCDPEGSATQEFACDGINPLRQYIADEEGRNARTGDLVLPEDDQRLARGLEDQATRTSPVYIFFVAPDSDSFVFSKAGGVSIN